VRTLRQFAAWVPWGAIGVWLVLLAGVTIVALPGRGTAAQAIGAEASAAHALPEGVARWQSTINIALGIAVLLITSKADRKKAGDASAAPVLRQLGMTDGETVHALLQGNRERLDDLVNVVRSGEVSNREAHGLIRALITSQAEDIHEVGQRVRSLESACVRRVTPEGV
jgi:hypothetical protein